MSSKIIFENTPDMDKIMKVMCELMERESRGEYEYTYELDLQEVSEEQICEQDEVEQEQAALVP